MTLNFLADKKGRHGVTVDEAHCGDRGGDGDGTHLKAADAVRIRGAGLDTEERQARD